MLALSYTTGLCADTIWFINNRSEKVLIQKESADSVTYRQGKATITLQKRVVTRIQYDSAAENAQLESEWQRQYFCEDPFVPAELKDWAIRFRALKKTRAELHATKERSRGAAAQAVRADLLRDRRQEIAADLKTLTPQLSSKLTRSNALLEQINTGTLQLNELVMQGKDAARQASLRQEIGRLRPQWEVLAAEISPLRKKEQALIDRDRAAFAELGRIEQRVFAESRLAGQTQAYVQAIDDFRMQLGRTESMSQRRRHPVFFNELDRRLAEMTADLITEKIHGDREGGAIKVQAVVNGREAVTLVFDTGATRVTLSEAAALRLGIVPDKSGGEWAVLADGSRTKATPVTLDSLQVGSAVRKKVPAVILERPPGAGVDGLLGMSFLKYFSVRLNAEKGEIELIHL